MSIEDKDFIVDEYGNAFISLHLTADLCSVDAVDIVSFFDGKVDFDVGISPRQLIEVLHYFAHKEKKSAIDSLAMFSSIGANDFIYNGLGYKRGTYNGYRPYAVSDNCGDNASYSALDSIYRRSTIGILALLSCVVTGAVILAIIGEFLK